MSDPAGPSGRGSGKGRKVPWQPLHRASKPTPVRQALDQLASTMGLGSIEGINRLFLAWPEIVGDDVASHCSPKRLSDGVLTVEAADRQWAVELSWMTDLIVERCTAALGEGQVVEARIVGPSPI